MPNHNTDETPPALDVHCETLEGKGQVFQIIIQAKETMKMNCYGSPLIETHDSICIL